MSNRKLYLLSTFFILWFSILGLLALLRLICLVIMSVVVVKGSIKHNNTLIVSEHRLGDLIHDFTEFFYCLEYVALICGICELVKYVYKERKQQETQETKVEGQQTLQIRDGIKISYCISAIAVLLLALGLNTAPPVLLVVWKNETFYHYQNKYVPVVQGYIIGNTAAYVHTFVMETVMVIVTVIVKVMWWNNTTVINRLKEFGEDYRENTEDKVKELETNYNETGKKVEQILTVFPRWFIVRLIGFIIDTAGYLVLIMKNRYQGAEFTYGIYILVHLLSDFMAFLTFYFCGLTINFSHEKYHKNLTNMHLDILSHSHHDQVRLMKYTGTIPANSKYELRPTLCSITITLKNPGYSVALLLSLFAFIAKLVETVS